jgi:hypothetical protein
MTRLCRMTHLCRDAVKTQRPVPEVAGDQFKALPVSPNIASSSNARHQDMHNNEPPDQHTDSLQHAGSSDKWLLATMLLATMSGFS